MCADDTLSLINIINHLSIRLLPIKLKLVIDQVSNTYTSYPLMTSLNFFTLSVVDVLAANIVVVLKVTSGGEL